MTQEDLNMADLKTSRCGDTANGEVSPKAEEILSLLERRGIVEDQSIASKKARAADQKMRRKMYHNTQLMLKHYRDIVWALECFPKQVAEDPAAWRFGRSVRGGGHAACYGQYAARTSDAEHQAVAPAAGPDQ